MTTNQLVTIFGVGLNDIATIIALGVSGYSLYLQQKSTKREVGELEIKSIEKTIYSPGSGEVDDGMGGTQISNHHFQLHCNIRNSRDGILYIYSVRAILSDRNQFVELTYPGGEIQLEEREPISDLYLSGDLDYDVDLSDAVDAILQFETSNGVKTRTVIFTKKDSSQTGC